MKRWRIGSALAATAACALCVRWWPHARDAGAILAAQDNPTELAVSSSIRPAE